MIQIHGVITDPAGKPVPRALIELRALSTTGEVLMGSAMTFKCDQAGEYRFQLATGTYDVYAQNDQCGDMDYMGSGVVTAQSSDGPLNSILVDSGINLTPPLLDRALEAMQRSEAAAEATADDRQQIGSDVATAEQARLVATEQAAAASVSATTAGSKAGDATTSADAAAGSASNAQKWAENPVDVAVVPGKHSALHHATKANASASESATSATAAAASASTASAKATNANTSATTAATMAGEAATSASTAATHASAANNSKVTAATSATNAGSHASNAEKAAQAAEEAKVVTLDNAAKVGTLAEQVTADWVQVQESATQVAANATTVAGQAKEVSTNTDTVSQAKAAVQGMRDVVVAKTTQAQAAADTASSKASQAAQEQAAASASAQRAGMAEIKAEAWAQNPEGSDINGRPGEFSALHWAMQAQKWAQAISSQLVWAGPWNAAAGAPAVPAANQGIPFYRISHSGVIAGVPYVAGDYLHWDPTSRTWFKIDGSDAVISVNGMTGAVVLSAADVGARPASWVPGWADIIKPDLYPMSGGQLKGGVVAEGAVSATGSVIAEDVAKKSSLGLEADETGPYLSGKVPDENASSKLLVFTRKEVKSSKRLSSDEVRISTDAGLKFSPNEDLSGIAWGFGMDPATNRYMFHRYLDGVWKAAPMQLPVEGGIEVTSLKSMGNLEGQHVAVLHNANPRVELIQPGHSASLIYKPQNRQAIRFARSNGAGGETVAYGETDGDGFLTVGGRFRANYPAANRSWISKGQCPFWLEPQAVAGNGVLHGLVGTQYTYPGYWAVEMYHGVFAETNNADTLGHVFVGTDGGNYTKIWRLLNSGRMVSPGGWSIEPNGDLYSTRLGATVVDWVSAYFAQKNAASANADIVAGGWGQIGTYAHACCVANVGAQSAGYIIDGVHLKLACGADQWSGRGGTLPGTWKLLGYIVGNAQEGGWNTASWIRIR